MKGWYDMGWKIKRTRRLRRYAEDCTIDKNSVLYKALEAYNYQSIKEVFEDDEDDLHVTEKTEE